MMLQKMNTLNCIFNIATYFHILRDKYLREFVESI